MKITQLIKKAMAHTGVNTTLHPASGFHDRWISGDAMAYRVSFYVTDTSAEKIECIEKFLADNFNGEMSVHRVENSRCNKLAFTVKIPVNAKFTKYGTQSFVIMADGSFSHTVTMANKCGNSIAETHSFTLFNFINTLLAAGYKQQNEPSKFTMISQL